jgi:transcriptional regulator with XRE-family HTH domain
MDMHVTPLSEEAPRRSRRAATNEDVLLGERVRQLRRIRSLTQSQLARAVGLTFQQIQKYESGMNRISVCMLGRMSQALRVPVEMLLDGLFTDVAPPTPENGASTPTQVVPYGDRVMLLELYGKLASEEERGLVLQLMASLSGGRLNRVNGRRVVPERLAAE